MTASTTSKSIKKSSRNDSWTKKVNVHSDCYLLHFSNICLQKVHQKRCWNRVLNKNSQRIAHFLQTNTDLAENDLQNVSTKVNLFWWWCFLGASGDTSGALGLKSYPQGCQSLPKGSQRCPQGVQKAFKRLTHAQKHIPKAIPKRIPNRIRVFKIESVRASGSKPRLG